MLNLTIQHKNPESYVSVHILQFLHLALTLPHVPQAPQGLKHNTCISSFLDDVFKNTTYMEQLFSFQGLSCSFFTNNTTKKP